jgi:hypothetical protein
MSNNDVEFALTPDGELVLKNADRDQVRAIVAAMRRAIAKNTDEVTSAAYHEPGEHEDAEHDQDDADDAHAEDDDEEAELTLRQRRAAEYRRQLEALARAGVAPPVTTTTRKAMTMFDDASLEKISKSESGLQLMKNFVGGSDDFRPSEHQVTSFFMSRWGPDNFAKRYQSQDAEGLLARRAVERARNANWLGA